MADLQGRKVFKVFNQDFIVDERYNVTKELGQGAYGIVWCVTQSRRHHPWVFKDTGPSFNVLFWVSQAFESTYSLFPLQRSHQ